MLSDYFSSTLATLRILTGPSNPDSSSGESFFHNRQLVKVKRPLGLGLPSWSHCGQRSRVPLGLRSLSSGRSSSPIMRLIGRLTTRNSSTLSPALMASVMSTQ